MEPSLAALLVEATSDAFVVVDAAERVVAVNAAAERLFGWNRDDIVGAPLHTLFPERFRAPRVDGSRGRTNGRRPGERSETAPEALDPVESLARDATAVLTALRKDGSEFPAEVFLSPLLSPDGLLAVASVRDIRARLYIEEALAATEVRLRDFFHQASDGIFVADQQGHFTEVNPAGCQLTGNDHAVWGDSDRLSQVLENLLSNAVKYGSAGTPIQLRVAKEGAHVVFDVINWASGIAHADLTGIFGRYQRAGIAAHRTVPGLGLGLQIAQGLVEAHGGTLSAESTGDGRTTFRVLLPHYPRAAPSAPAVRDRAESARARGTALPRKA